MDFPFGGLATILGPFSFFAGIALMMWIDQRGKAGQRQLQHAERLRALELGRELPDAAVARAESRSSRAAVTALVGWLVPLLVMASGVGGTALVLLWASAEIHLPVLCTIWGACGLVCVVAVTSSLGALQHQGKNDPIEPQSTPGAPRPNLVDRPLDPRQLDLDIVSKER